MSAHSKLTTVYIPDSKEEAIKVRALLRKGGVKFHNVYLNLNKPMPYKPVVIKVDDDNIDNAIVIIQKMVDDEKENRG
jgi:hypothetical protein